MNVMKWKTKKLVAVIVGVIILFFWFRPRQYTYTSDIKIPKAPPNEVWEYMADFSNMVKLNPTMIDFTIISESGNYKHWQYVANYREKLGHWPYIENTNVGHFSVVSDWRSQHYSINSTHLTCFYLLFCLHSEAEFKFSHFNYAEMKPINIGTLYEEVIKYQCPPILSYFCGKEIKSQRDTIIKNLANQFDK